MPLWVAPIKINHNKNAKTGCDTLVIGGGLLGSAIAIGLAKRDHNVTVLDGGDADLRASRGNFGLTWVQGKGAGNASYAQWTGRAVEQWPAYADELKIKTGIDVEFEQKGGLDFCMTKAAWLAQADIMEQVKQHTHGRFRYEMLDNVSLRQFVPEVSPLVYGASFSPHDGHVNPLKLMRAQQIYLRQLGCTYRPNMAVTDIQCSENGFVVGTEENVFHGEKLILCAGLSNSELAANIGLSIPLRANQGQLLITERVPPFLHYPSIHIRQTQDGTLQIGDSSADVGLNDNTKLGVIAEIAARLMRIFPHLCGVNVIRSWSALRVMTPDGLPIYEQSASQPNAFSINCHSGVTLAAQHATVLSDWLACPTQTHTDGLIGDFSSYRLHVSNH